MPLENEMKSAKDFRGFTGILNRAMFIIVSLYIGLGLVGYIRYGADIQSTITVNLPNEMYESLCLSNQIGTEYSIKC